MYYLLIAFSSYKDVFELAKARPNILSLYAIIQVNQPNNIIIYMVVVKNFIKLVFNIAMIRHMLKGWWRSKIIVF